MNFSLYIFVNKHIYHLHINKNTYINSIYKIQKSILNITSITILINF